jgi:GNAT superfamily N-acetyltransferase
MILTRGEFLVTDDREVIDMTEVVRLLRTTYWGEKRAEYVIRSTWENSAYGFTMYQVSNPGSRKLIGFCRVVSDLHIHSYLADVFVLPEFRGRGLGQWMLECVLGHPAFKTTRWVLYTRDMHPLYRKLGFIDPNDTLMMRERQQLPDRV